MLGAAPREELEQRNAVLEAVQREELEQRNAALEAVQREELEQRNAALEAEQREEPARREEQGGPGAERRRLSVFQVVLIRSLPPLTLPDLPRRLLMRL